jgi:hypothetical protein
MQQEIEQLRNEREELQRQCIREQQECEAKHAHAKTRIQKKLSECQADVRYL